VLGIRSNEARETNFEFGICNLECKRIQNRGIRDSLRLRDWRLIETEKLGDIEIRDSLRLIETNGD